MIYMGKRMDICICKTDSLCCKPEANSILLINYTTIIFFSKWCILVLSLILEAFRANAFSFSSNIILTFFFKNKGIIKPDDNVNDTQNIDNSCICWVIHHMTRHCKCISLNFQNNPMRFCGWHFMRKKKLRKM